MSELSRRRFLQAASLVPLAAALPRGFLAEAMAATPGTFDFFDAHQAAVVREATARLIPGPEDDPLEAGHAGAREANVVRYIDVLLGAFTADPPRIFASGPWSDRSGGRENHMEDFVPLTPQQEQVWRKRVTALQKAYRDGVAALDAEAGGDFATASADAQDQALNQVGEFRDLLFVHAIEGFLSAPEYGGNERRAGWTEISYRGDTQPRGYTPPEVAESDGLDPVVPDALLLGVMANFQNVAVQIAARRRLAR